MAKILELTSGKLEWDTTLKECTGWYKVWGVFEKNWGRRNCEIMKEIMKLDGWPGTLDIIRIETAKCWERLIPNIRQNVKVRGSYWHHRRDSFPITEDGKKSENQAQNLISRVAKLKEGWLLNRNQSASSTSISKLGPVSQICTHWQKGKTCSDKKGPCSIIVRTYRNESPDTNRDNIHFLGQLHNWGKGIPNFLRTPCQKFCVNIVSQGLKTSP